MQESLASVLWPSLTEPMVSKLTWQSDWTTKDEKLNPSSKNLSAADREENQNDLIRGLLLLMPRLGYPPTLVTRPCFKPLFSISMDWRGHHEWRSRREGWATLVDELIRVSQSTGKVTFATNATVHSVEPTQKLSSLAFDIEGKNAEIDARFVLCNASAKELARLTGKAESSVIVDEGTAFKVNMLLKRLPRLRSEHYSHLEAFAGTFTPTRDTNKMLTSYDSSRSGQMPSSPPGEVYCHTLTDPSILSPELQAKGFHTLTLFD